MKFQPITANKKTGLSQESPALFVITAPILFQLIVLGKAQKSG